MVKKSFDENAPIIIILGQYLQNNGDLSLKCRERCIEGLNLYGKFPKSKFLLSGGKVNLIAKKSEAQAMCDYIATFGVDKNECILEENSENTYENAKFCKQILKTMEYSRLFLVTSSSHMYRWYYNPMRFFKWLFFLRVKRSPSLDSNISCRNFNASKVSVLCFVKNGKEFEKFVADNQDKNIFLKLEKSRVRKGRFSKSLVWNEENIQYLANYVKKLYKLEELQIKKI